MRKFTLLASVLFASNLLMGATSPTNFLIIYALMLKKDSLDENYYIPNYKTQTKLFERYIDFNNQSYNVEGFDYSILVLSEFKEYSYLCIMIF
jgi:hypothetical protein